MAEPGEQNFGRRVRATRDYGVGWELQGKPKVIPNFTGNECVSDLP